ncbi:MAG: glycosyltransferase [Conexivisphaera sp.]
MAGSSHASATKRIAIVSPYPPPGGRSLQGSGVVQYSKGLAEALARHFQVHVIADSLEGVPAEYSENGVVIHRVFRSNPLYPFSIFRQLLRIRPDIVHVQHSYFLYGGFLEGVLFPLLLAMSRLVSSVVVTMHDLPSIYQLNDEDFLRMNSLPARRSILKAGVTSINRSIAALADAVIVHEDFLRDVAIRDYRMPVHKVIVRPHGVERVRPLDRGRARANLGIGDDRVLVLFFGYLARYKGVDLLVKVLRNRLDWRKYSLIIAGGPHPRARDDPGYREWFRDLVNNVDELRREGADVRLTGFVEDPSPYFSAADLVVLPYVERFSASGPASLAEAYGLPVFLADGQLRASADLEDAITRFIEERGGDPGTVHARFWDEMAADYYSFLVRTRNSGPQSPVRR